MMLQEKLDRLKTTALLSSEYEAIINELVARLAIARQTLGEFPLFGVYGDKPKLAYEAANLSLPFQSNDSNVAFTTEKGE